MAADLITAMQEPFFIVGSGRCGTTLLRRQILERTRTIIPPENYVLAFTQKCFALAEGDWAKACTLLVDRLTKVPHHWDTYKVDRSRFLEELLTMPDQRKRMAVIWHVLAKQHAEAFGVSAFDRWGDKTPMNAFHLEEVVALYPSAQFVFLVRHPFDVARSFGQMPANRGEFRKGIDRWLDANSAILAFIPERRERCQLLRYEDLVTRNHDVLVEVLEFLDLESIEPRDVRAFLTDVRVFEHLQNATNPVSGSSIGLGAALPQEIRSYANERIGPLAAQLGYTLNLGDHR